MKKTILPLVLALVFSVSAFAGETQGVGGETQGVGGETQGVGRYSQPVEGETQGVGGETSLTEYFYQLFSNAINSGTDE